MEKLFDIEIFFELTEARKTKTRDPIYIDERTKIKQNKRKIVYYVSQKQFTVK